MLDERLSLVRDLYEPCPLAADIGTDHGRLPAELLKARICERMILTDLSPDALENARQRMRRLRLLSRVSLRLGDGLLPLKGLETPCGVVSVTGMGGRTIQNILLQGADLLRGATLILSAHTDLPLIREALNRIGYVPDREEPVFCAGRYYLVLRSRPGQRRLTDREIRLGSCLFRSESPDLSGYLHRRQEVLAEKRRGLLSAEQPDADLIRQTEADMAYYDGFLTAEPDAPVVSHSTINHQED